MKRIYSLLPANILKQVRAVLEFDGGVSDTHVLRAGPETDKWTYGPIYRPPPASQPQARIPVGPASRTFDIKYFPRDARRGVPVVTLPIEASFAPEFQAALAPREVDLPASIDIPAGKPIDGTFKNPDVERYDKTGLRSALTASTVATQRELRRNTSDHNWRPSWWAKKDTAEWLDKLEKQQQAGVVGVPVGRTSMKRPGKWAYIASQERYL